MTEANKGFISSILAANVMPESATASNHSFSNCVCLKPGPREKDFGNKPEAWAKPDVNEESNLYSKSEIAGNNLYRWRIQLWATLQLILFRIGSSAVRRMAYPINHLYDHFKIQGQRYTFRKHSTAHIVLGNETGIHEPFRASKRIAFTF